MFKAAMLAEDYRSAISQRPYINGRADAILHALVKRPIGHARILHRPGLVRSGKRTSSSSGAEGPSPLLSHTMFRRLTFITFCFRPRPSQLPSLPSLPPFLDRLPQFPQSACDPLPIAPDATTSAAALLKDAWVPAARPCSLALRVLCEAGAVGRAITFLRPFWGRRHTGVKFCADTQFSIASVALVRIILTAADPSVTAPLAPALLSVACRPALFPFVENFVASPPAPSLAHNRCSLTFVSPILKKRARSFSGLQRMMFHLW